MEIVRGSQLRERDVIRGFSTSEAELAPNRPFVSHWDIDWQPVLVEPRYMTTNDGDAAVIWNISTVGRPQLHYSDNGFAGLLAVIPHYWYAVERETVAA